MKSGTRDRGASAVEFALVAPVLVLMLLGIIAFGHAFHVQSALSNAARDGVRVMALSDAPADARQTVIESASPSATVAASQISVTPTSCAAAGTTGPGTATVTITYPLNLLGLGTPVNLTGKGTMRCNG
jgi:Flp pilus assembly protein TadG